MPGSGSTRTAVSLCPYADGTWGVDALYFDGGADKLTLGQHAVYDDDRAISGHFGSHPWSSIATINWSALPASREEALARLDTTGWAAVNNPDPATRLHLRVSADETADSLGSYYNGTPMVVREQGADWCAVTVGGVDGWMKTDSLAFGADM